MNKALLLILTVLSSLVVAACHSVDDERIPYADVRVTFRTIGDWHQYGVSGGDTRRFIHTEQENTPAGFPYTVADRTGYGGLLLAMDAMGNIVVFDLACPVEVRPTIRVYVPEGETYAQCPKCGSTYDIFTNHGNPRSGPANEHGYALTRYSAIYGGALEYLTITR